MLKYIFLLILLTGFHYYFFYNLWLLWKKGTNELDWHHGFRHAISANVVVSFWIKFLNFI